MAIYYLMLSIFNTMSSDIINNDYNKFNYSNILNKDQII